jgi:MFS family permease
VTSPAGGTDRAWPAAFRALWIGQTISSVGSQVSFVAIPLIAALFLHAGPFEMAVLGALETLPFVLLSLPFGVVADRSDRRRLLIACDIGRAVAMGSVPLLFALGYGSIAWLCIAAVAVSSLSALFTVCQQAFVPEIVTTDQLLRANQRLEVSDSAARVAGPGLAALLIQLGGVVLAIATDALSYLLSGVALLMARSPSRTPVASSSEPQPVVPAVLTGLRFVWLDKSLRLLMISTAIFNLASGMVLAQLVLLATGNVESGGVGFGVMMAIGNVGFVIGAALVVRLESRLGTGPLLVTAGAFGALALWLIAAAGVVGSFGLLVAGRFLGAVSVPASNVTLVSLRQARTPDAVRARVAATFRTVDWGTAPLGAILSGVIGVALGVPAVMVCAALLGSLSLVAIARPAVLEARLEPDAATQRALSRGLGLEAG